VSTLLGDIANKLFCLISYQFFLRYLLLLIGLSFETSL
jgi:hypothetical protein